jgi:DNA-binding IclR family transcriptional regulator
VLDWLVNETAESIFLSIIDGTEILVVDARESPRSIRLSGKAGGRGPLYAGGTPKVLLAFLPADERRALLKKIELIPLTPYTITNPVDLEQHLCQIREQGYVVTAGDIDVGAHSIAAPIRDYQDRVIAAISIAGPSHRFTDECITAYVKLVLEGAAQISRALGCKDC